MKKLISVLLALCCVFTLIVAPVSGNSPVAGDPPTYSEGVKRIILQNYEEWQAAWPLGDCGQQMNGIANCLENPHIIYVSQDVGPPRVSVDGGISWFYPQWEGMHSYLTNGVMCDPLDPRRVAVITNQAYPEVVMPGSAGLWVSFDGGQTAELKVVHDPNYGDSPHANSQGIGFNPASESGGKANHWLFIGYGTLDVVPVWHSIDGMVNWSERSSLLVSDYGMVKHIIGDSSNDNTYYAAFSTGLYRITNAHTGGFQITKLSGSGNLVAGAVLGPPYVSQDGKTIIVGVEKKGVYKSIDGGLSWMQVSSQPNLHKLFINPYNPDYMGYSVNATGKGGAPMFSRDGGLNFSPPNYIEKRPGFTGTLSPGYQKGQAVYTDKANPGKLWWHGRQTNTGQAQSDWRSEDGGITLILADKGMNGCHLGPVQNTQWVDPANKNRMVLPVIDFQIHLTTDGLKSMTRYNVSTDVRVAGTHSTILGAILHPTLNRWVFAMNDGSKGPLYVYDDGTYTNPVPSKERFQGLCYNPDTLVAFGSKWRSEDWLIWNIMPNLPEGCVVIGCTTGAVAPQAIFAVDRNASPSSQNIYRSVDDGETWQLVLTADYLLTTASLNGCRVHPTNKEVIFTRSSDPAKVRRWDLSSGTPDNRLFTDLAPFEGGDGASYDFLAIDPRFPDVMYARNNYHGVTHKLMRSVDGGNSWTNLSHLAPRGQGQSMHVMPLTGELLFSTSGGMWLINPPYEQDGKLSDGLLTDGNMLKDNYLDGFWTVSSATPAPKPTPTPTPKAAYNFILRRMIFAENTPAPMPTATPTPMPTATPVPAPMATPEPAATPTPVPIEASQVYTAPVIDGNLDIVWDGKVIHSISKIITETISSTVDLSGEFGILWDNSNLYVMVDVVDDALVIDSDLDHQDDSVEIYLDMNHDEGTAYGSDDFQYRFGYGRTAVVETKHKATEGVEFGIVPTDNGYRVEVKIPWSTLGYTPSVDAIFGLDVHINDDDDGVERDGKMSWWSNDDKAFKFPDRFGDCILIESTEPTP